MWLHAIAYASALASTTLAQNATSASPSNSTVECSDGLKMFVSRGTSEPQGAGETGKVVEAIAGKINGSSYQANPYPASGDDPNYFISVANGTAGLKKMVGEYAEKCPGGRMALFGYSQGAQVTSNILCGMPAVWALYGGVDPIQLEELQAFSSPLPRDITKNGTYLTSTKQKLHSTDTPPSAQSSPPSSSAIQPTDQNQLTIEATQPAAVSSGEQIRMFARVTAIEYGRIVLLVIPFCDVGPDLNATAHLTYVADYGREVIDFVVRQYENGGEEGAESDAGADEEAGDEGSVAAQESTGTWSWSISGVAVVASLLVFGML